MREIDSKLSDGEIVGIGVDARFIDPSFEKGGLNGHAVSIVGRRFNPTLSQCEYRIRNSWGTEWGEEGYKYIPRQHLVPGIKEVVYLLQPGRNNPNK